MSDSRGVPAGAGRTIIERGRAKAFRPMPAADRAAAYRAGVEAYERGDYFLAHELLEPAWMGTDDPAERALHSGLIKLAAAGVHAVRHNPAGVAKNLAGARSRLAAASSSQDPTMPALDLAVLLRSIDDQLGEAATVGRADATVPANDSQAITEPPQLPRRRSR